MKKLSIIIVTYNSLGDIYDCIESIYKYADIPREQYEIIVVENNSPQGEEMFEGIRKRWGEDVKLIMNKKNGGYGQGNNVGILASEAPVIMIMNPDVRLYEPVFKCVLDAYDKDELLSIYGMKQMHSPDVPNKLSILWTPMTNGYLWTIASSICANKDWYFPRWMYISGACFFCRKDILKKAGMFDENNFMYGEEDDIRYRIRALGETHILYNKNLHYIHLIEEREITVEYYMKQVKSSMYLHEKKGFSRKDTLHSYIQHANIMLIKNKIGKLFGKPDKTTHLYKCLKSTLHAEMAKL